MRDNLPRRFLKAIARAVFFADSRLTRVIRRARGERPHRLRGDCRLCAKCCESPTIQTNALVLRNGLVKRLWLGWHRRVNGFELIRQAPEHRAFVFRCTHFDEETRRCDSYGSRPGMCRDYPRALLWEPEPPFLPGCGYRSVGPNAQKVADMIDSEADLTPEKREELKRKLRCAD
ncbi:MAG: YkgJ family cysteine cluster protein [Sumerlaeia bacterium]